MKKTLHQLLMLSGFYFIIAFTLSSWKTSYYAYTFIFFFALFVVLFVLLCFKKSFSFFEKFDNKNPKISNYLKAAGLAQYYNIIFGLIPGFFVSDSVQVPVYFNYAAIGYFALLFVSLVYATYLNCPKCKFCKKEFAKNEPVLDAKETVVEKAAPITKKETAKKPAPKKTITQKTETKTQKK